MVSALSYRLLKSSLPHTNTATNNSTATTTSQEPRSLAASSYSSSSLSSQSTTVSVNTTHRDSGSSVNHAFSSNNNSGNSSSGSDNEERVTANLASLQVVGSTTHWAAPIRRRSNAKRSNSSSSSSDSSSTPPDSNKKKKSNSTSPESGSRRRRVSGYAADFESLSSLASLSWAGKKKPMATSSAGATAAAAAIRRGTVAATTAQLAEMMNSTNREKERRAQEVGENAKRRKLAETQYAASNVREDLARAKLPYCPYTSRARALPPGSVDMNLAEVVLSSQYDEQEKEKSSASSAAQTAQMTSYQAYCDLWSNVRPLYTGKRRKTKTTEVSTPGRPTLQDKQHQQQQIMMDAGGSTYEGSFASAEVESTTSTFSSSASDTESDDSNATNSTGNNAAMTIPPRLEQSTVMRPCQGIWKKQELASSSNAVKCPPSAFLSMGEALDFTTTARMLVTATKPHVILHANKACFDFFSPTPASTTSPPTPLPFGCGQPLERWLSVGTQDSCTSVVPSMELCATLCASSVDCVLAVQTTTPTSQTTVTSHMRVLPVLNTVTTANDSVPGYFVLELHSTRQEGGAGSLPHKIVTQEELVAHATEAAVAGASTEDATGSTSNSGSSATSNAIQKGQDITVVG